MNKSTLIKKSIALGDMAKSSFSPDLTAEEMQEAVDIYPIPQWLSSLIGTFGGVITGNTIGQKLNKKQLEAIKRVNLREQRLSSKYDYLLNEASKSGGRNLQAEKLVHASPAMQEIKRMRGKNSKLFGNLMGVIDRRKIIGSRIGGVLGLSLGSVFPIAFQNLKKYQQNNDEFITPNITDINKITKSSANYGIEKKAQEEAMEKASALGYKALTGNLGPLKQIIKHLRKQGYSGLGGRVHDPNLGRFKHTPISRVIPSNPKAQLPNTQHLPIGESKAFFNSGNARSLVVGKGMPRMNLDIKDKNLVGYIPGMPGGTNPSPISSFLHEAGHLEHARMVKQLAQSNSKVFGSNLPYSLKDYGIHGISSGKYNPLTLLDEVGANNSALQLLKQTGATPQAQAFYKGVRYPSFKTHLDSAISDQTPNASSLINKITKEAPHGFTQDYSGINRFYNV